MTLGDDSTILTQLHISVAFSCILLAQVGSSGAVLNDHREINTSLIFFSLSVSLNAVLTTLIVARILWVKSKVSKDIGVEHTRTYLSVISMLIESASLYTITGLAYIAAFKTSSPALSVIGGFYGIMPVRHSLFSYTLKLFNLPPFFSL